MHYSGSKFRCFFVILFIVNSLVHASKATIDDDGGANYTSLDALLQYYSNSSSTIPDTVLFTGADVDTYTMSTYLNEAPSTGVLFLGQNEDPDKFPVIMHDGGNYYNFFQSKKISFENIVFTGTYSFYSTGNAQPITFRKCVVFGFSTTSFMNFDGTGVVQVLFENCLFVKNAYGIFDLNILSGGRKIEFINCTFDDNKRLFILGSNKIDTNIVMKNCIFSGNDSIYTSTKMKSNISYSLTSESSTSGYGEGCVSDAPQYVTTTGRAIPSDWKIPQKSPAAKIGTLTDAPTVDIGNRSRLSTSNDVGCWVPDVPSKPDITDEPDTVVVNEDSTVSFSVTVTGVELEYAWYDSGSTIKLSDSSKLIVKAAFSDSGAKYYCIVSNGGGADTSNLAILNVLRKPEITKDLSDTVVSVNDTFFLFINASGSNITYQWYRNKSPISAETKDTLEFKGISLNNNGDTLYCVVKNILGKSVSSKSIVLTVKDNEGAKIKTQPLEYISVTMGDPLSFSTEAYGSGVIKYVWYKDGLNNTDSVGYGMIFNNSSATLADSGSYRCVVSNEFGKDTSNAITVKVVDPSQLRCRLQLTGEFIDREHVRIWIKNLKSITGTMPNPNVDTVAIWSDTADYPLQISAKTLQFKIPMSLFTKNSDEFDTTLTFQRLSDECYSRYFIPVLSWKDPDTVLVGEMSSGAVVSSCSQEKLENPIKIDCAYITLSDTVNVNLTDIPVGSARDSMQYLIIQYGNNALGITNDTILVDNLPSDGTFKHNYVSSDFLNDPQIITFNVLIRGILGNLSDTISEKIQVGIERPANSINNFKADSAFTDAVGLAWTILPTENVDSIRIWNGKIQIPLKYNPDTSLYSFISLDGNERSYRFGDLDINTLYYFAAQIKKDGLWSSITTTASTSHSTLAPTDTQRVLNTIVINGVKFDTATNILTVRWNIDRDDMEDLTLQAAICFSADGFIENGPGADDTIIENINYNSENVTKITWNGSKLFGVTYYLSMFMRKENAIWSESAEDAKSTVSIPLAKWESITFFNSDQDSIYVLNRSILVRKGNNWNSSSIPSSDEILQDTLPVKANGFIRIGTPFRFKKAEGTPDIEVGTRYGSIPDGYSAKDIYLYVYKNNSWYAEPRIAVDSASKMIFSNFPIDSATYRKNVHVLMIDTATPDVEITYDSTPVEAGSGFIYPFSVKDNIANVVCSLKCGSIDQAPVLIKVITPNDTVFDGILDVPGSTNAKSIRVLLTVTDYMHTKIYDLSRQVVVDKNSKASIEGVWVPVSTITVLDEPSIEHAFLGICDGEEWKYDSTRFRIFNWHTAGDGSNAGYVQYSKNKSDIFNVVPGEVFWLKRKVDGAFDLGPGKTVSIKEPFTVNLTAGQWTDFCLPYNINISLADIFSASEMSNKIQDSVWFFEFTTKSNNLGFNTVYYPVLGTDQSKTEIVLKYTQGNAYTVYNASSKNVDLTIPPIDVSYSSGNGSLQKKSQENNEWYIKIVSEAQNEITVPVYCVFKRNEQHDGMIKLPSPPHPGNIQIGLLDSVDNKTYGTFIFDEYGQGYSIPLYFSNSSSTESKTITYSVSASRSEYTANCVFYNPENSNFEPLSKSNLTVTLGPGEHAYRWALVGDSSYFHSWINSFVNVRFGLTKVFGMRGNNLGIEYTVPYSGVSAVKVMVINQLGQCIWSAINRNLVPGKINSTNWNINTSNRLAAGAYIIQVSAYNAAHRQVHKAQGRYLHIK